jgi:hypothetical protein
MFAKNSFSGIHSKFNLERIEPFFFGLILLLNLYPVLIFPFFATIDGPAHIYNSNLLFQMLTGEKSLLNSFYKINPEAVPNWTGHFIMAFFRSLFSGQVAEKIFQLIYFAGLPLVFRRLLNKTSANHLLSYFIFPFTHNFPFYSGFYNFSIAIVLMFLSISFWVEQQNRFSFKTWGILFFLITLVYFCHLLIFGILCLIIGMLIVASLITSLISQNESSVKNKLLEAAKKTLLLLLSSSLSLYLCFSYFTTRPLSETNTFIEGNILLQYLMNIRSLTVFMVGEEQKITVILFYLVLLLTLIAIGLNLNRLRKSKTAEHSPKRTNGSLLFSLGNIWLIIALLMLFLYFAVPDETHYGSLMSVRINLLFYLFFILWLCSQRFPKWVSIFSFFIIMMCHIMLLHKRNQYISEASKVAAECFNIERLIDPYSIVLPFDYSENWLRGHFSNYPGINKPMIILENYECEVGYFPIIWDEDNLPNVLLGNLNRDDAQVYWKSNPYRPAIQIKYVFVYGNVYKQPDFPSVPIHDAMEKYYKVIFQSNYVKLYQLK